ncbi:MAG: DUF4124 domain-containing protein [Moraxellaceae bacterium]|nr:DUF4124 domain-containing protein [Moraxellaceae bacterium]
MQSNSLVIVVVMSAIIGGAWMERDALKKYWDNHVNPPSQASQTTLYTWKDSEGTIHFSSHADDKHAKEVVVDTNKITPIESPPPSKKLEKEKNQSFVMDIRDENERTRKIIQAAKDKQTMPE